MTTLAIAPLRKRNLAREIKDDDCQMATLRRRLFKFVRRSDLVEHASDALVLLLVELRDELALRFALEECTGLFEEAVAQQAHLCELADALRSEHECLYDEACRLADHAEQAVRRSRRLSRRVARDLLARFQRLDESLQLHEAREEDFVHEAMNVDVGVCD